jgi:hypothetical protein
MKIVFITNNIFGEQGTPGTYELIDRMSLKADIEVFSRKSKVIDNDIVFYNKGSYRIHEINYNSLEDVEWLITKILSFGPHVLYFCSGQIWKANEAKIIRKVKENKPDVKAVLDIKSPPLIDDPLKLQQVRKESSKYQYMLDKIFSRAQEDIQGWFSDIQTDTFIYPLGISLASFRSKPLHEEIIFSRNFIYIGSVHEKRQIDQLLINISYLPGFIKKKFRLDIYGSGPFLEEAKDLIFSKNLSNNVILHGSVNQVELFKVLPNYDVGIGWVPYQNYDFSPSLKSFEYIAAGLIPLVSNTIAHQRLLESGFNIEFFSMDHRSFKNAIHKLCFEGINASKILENLELIKHYDWNAVIEGYLYPELERLVKKEDKHSNISIQEETINEPQRQILSQLQGKNVLFVYDSESIVNSSSKSILKCFKNFKINVAACHPLSQTGQQDDAFFCEIPCYVWGETQNCAEILKKALSDFSPQLIVLFYSGQHSLFLLKELVNKNASVIVSERVPPERTIIQNTDSSQSNRSYLAWQREILFANADCIHLQHQSHLDSVPEFLHSRIEVFCDDVTVCSIKSNNNVSDLVTYSWSRLMSKALDMKNNKDQSAYHDWISLERNMHANRIIEKFIQQSKTNL